MFKFKKKRFQTIAVIEVFLQVYEYTLHAEYWKSPMHFVLYRHHTPMKCRVSLFGFESNLSNACASTTIFADQGNFVMALWASIFNEQAHTTCEQ